MSKALEQALKDSLSGNKCRIGSKEVLRSVKDSKLIVCSSSLSVETRKTIVESAKTANVPIYSFNDTSVELGRLCNKPFRISVISIDNSSKSNISNIFDEINK